MHFNNNFINIPLEYIFGCLLCRFNVLLEQVYLHLADMSGQADTREKLDSRLDNLQKAAEALDLAIARLTPEHEIKVP